MPTEDASYFGEAAARWETIIEADLSSYSGQQLYDWGFSPPANCTYPETIDGALLGSSLVTISHLLHGAFSQLVVTISSNRSLYLWKG